MPTNFNSPDGDIATLYLTDYALIDQYSTTGSLWMWGYNYSGQLGDNTTTQRNSPVQTVSGGTTWRQISVGSRQVGAIKTDGTLWMWGDNNYGQLGDNTRTRKSSPVQTVSGGTNWYQVSAGYASASIKTDGTLWIWGQNNYGQLGTNNTTPYSSPVQTVAGGFNWKQVSSGGYCTAAIKTDGTLWLWGRNTKGQLGDNSGGSGAKKSSPVQTVAGGFDWKQVSICNYSTGAVKTDGTLWMWGYNSYGQLGDNTIVNKSSPIQTVAGGTNWKQVAASDQHSAAIKTDGTLWLWGRNNYGQLGDNTRTDKSSPIQTVAGGANWKQISVSFGTSGTIKTDGTLWTWGKNTQGQLGTNNTTSYSSPVQTVAGGTNWKQVSCGYFQTGGIYFYDPGNLYPSA